jgi:hypothetical protein
LLMSFKDGADGESMFTGKGDLSAKHRFSTMP